MGVDGENVKKQSLVFSEVKANLLTTLQAIIRGYYTAVFISTRISRSSVDYQPEAKAEG